MSHCIAPLRPIAVDAWNCPSSNSVLLGLLLAGWTFGAMWLVLAAQNRARAGARRTRSTARRLTRMIDDSPAVPLLVKADGKIEGPERLAAWLGLAAAAGLHQRARRRRGRARRRRPRAAARRGAQDAEDRLAVPHGDQSARLGQEPRGARASRRPGDRAGRRGAGLVVRLLRKPERARPAARRDRARATTSPRWSG